MKAQGLGYARGMYRVPLSIQTYDRVINVHGMVLAEMSQEKSGAGSEVMTYSKVHKSNKNLTHLFVYVHANSSVWLHVPGSQ